MQGIGLWNPATQMKGCNTNCTNDTRVLQPPVCDNQSKWRVLTHFGSFSPKHICTHNQFQYGNSEDSNVSYTKRRLDGFHWSYLLTSRYWWIKLDASTLDSPGRTNFFSFVLSVSASLQLYRFSQEKWFLFQRHFLAREFASSDS